jgi:small subunit ribosomal protein S21
MRQNRGKTLSGLKVTVRGDDLNGALRVLKKRMLIEGVFNELRERTAFRSKGEKKRLQRAAGRRRWLKKVDKLKEQGQWPNE